MSTPRSPQERSVEQSASTANEPFTLSPHSQSPPYVAAMSANIDLSQSTWEGEWKLPERSKGPLWPDYE